MHVRALARARVIQPGCSALSFLYWTQIVHKRSQYHSNLRLYNAVSGDDPCEIVAEGTRRESIDSLVQ
jgi:hypothetical protein